MGNRSNTSVRLTPEALRLLKELAKKLGVSQAAIMEMAIRKFAERSGVS
jgi:predicted transcriptional regulator